MKNKSKKTNPIVPIIIVLIVLALIALGITYYTFSKNNPSNLSAFDDQNNNSVISQSGENPGNQPDLLTDDAQRFYEEYPTVPVNNRFVYRSGQEIVDILRNGTGVVYLGFKECGWCQAYAPILNQVAEEMDLEKIYYFDIRQDRADNTDVYQNIVALLGDNLDFDEEGQPRIFVPDVTFVKNGEIVGHNNDTSMNTTAEHGTPEEFWTPERIDVLKTELKTHTSKLAPAGICGSGCNL